MLGHSDIRNFKCSTCGKAFVRKDGLDRHELIHSNAQTHVCQVCGKTFPVRNYLYIICDLIINQKANLKVLRGLGQILLSQPSNSIELNFVDPGNVKSSDSSNTEGFE